MTNTTEIYNSIIYGIYKLINGTMYFKELFERVDIMKGQNRKMVDILI